ncbi:MAG: hypothetical protein ACE5MM_08605 [Nitrospiraceae bacterium]
MWLTLGLILVFPTLTAGWTATVTTLFLAEFLSQRDLPTLSALTPVPVTEPLAVGAVTADLHRPAAHFSTPAPLVLVHGLTPHGKDDPELRQAARLLARAGFAISCILYVQIGRIRKGPDLSRTGGRALRRGS